MGDGKIGASHRESPTIESLHSKGLAWVVLRHPSQVNPEWGAERRVLPSVHFTSQLGRGDFDVRLGCNPARQWLSKCIEEALRRQSRRRQ